MELFWLHISVISFQNQFWTEASSFFLYCNPKSKSLKISSSSSFFILTQSWKSSFFCSSCRKTTEQGPTAGAGAFCRLDPKAPDWWRPERRMIWEEFWFRPEWSGAASTVSGASSSRRRGSLRQKQSEKWKKLKSLINHWKLKVI